VFNYALAYYCFVRDYCKRKVTLIDLQNIFTKLRNDSEYCPYEEILAGLSEEVAIKLVDKLPIKAKFHLVDSDFTWLSQLQSQIPQAALGDFFNAVKCYYSGQNRPPVFKKKGKGERFSYPQGVQVEGNSVYLPKLGFVPFVNSRDLPEGAIVKKATVFEKKGQWYASIPAKFRVLVPVKELKTPSPDQVVGIDSGAKRAFTTWDGQASLEAGHQNFGATAEEEAKLNKLKSKRDKYHEKGSRGYERLTSRIRDLECYVADRRRDNIHKLTTQLAKNHSVFVLEDLDVKGMTATASGTVEDPGTNVAQKSGLNRVILSQGWSIFKAQLIAKAERYGCKVILINPAYTSQTCSECKHCDKKNRRSQSEFVCVACGYKDNADINAAKNIRAAGLVVLEGLRSGDFSKACKFEVVSLDSGKPPKAFFKAKKHQPA
jgi:putative transposase